MPWHVWVLIAGAHFLALLSPGPDFLLVVRSALARGPRAGFLASLGIAAANGVYIVLAIAGLSPLRERSDIYDLVYWSGCVYLAWLGTRFWRAASCDAGMAPGELAAAPQRGSLVLSGFLSGVLNPKNGLFYLALFSALAGRHASLAARSACGLWMVCVVLGWDCALACAVGHPRVMARCGHRQGWIHRGGALAMWSICTAMLLGTAWHR